MSDIPIVNQLTDACTARAGGFSICPAHQINNRCLTCQAADVIERTFLQLKVSQEQIDLLLSVCGEVGIKALKDV